MQIECISASFCAFPRVCWVAIQGSFEPIFDSPRMAGRKCRTPAKAGRCRRELRGLRGAKQGQSRRSVAHFRAFLCISLRRFTSFFGIVRGWFTDRCICRTTVFEKLRETRKSLIDRCTVLSESSGLRIGLAMRPIRDWLISVGCGNACLLRLPPVSWSGIPGELVNFGRSPVKPIDGSKQQTGVSQRENNPGRIDQMSRRRSV